MVTSFVTAMAFVMTLMLGGWLVWFHAAPLPTVFFLASCACSAGYLFGVQMGERYPDSDDDWGRP